MCFFHVFFPNNPLHTVQQKQNACAFTIGLIRRRVGTGGAASIAHYAGIMKKLAAPRILVTFDNDEKSRDTHGKFIIRKK